VRVLILRPAPGNAATAASVEAQGKDPVVVPLFEIVPLDWELPSIEHFEAVVMTSANAARLGGASLARLRRLPLFAVGESTARAAREAGFDDVVVGEGSAADLRDLIGPRSVLHLAGEDVVPLSTAMPATTIAVYAARQRELSVAERALLACPVAMIHSPRAGSAFADLCPDRSTTSLVAISAAAASACGTGWRHVEIADAPREAAMLASLARLCEAPPHETTGSV
jgi:uroporphyrinogen-III synthase